MVLVFTDWSIVFIQWGLIHNVSEQRDKEGQGFPTPCLSYPYKVPA